jgi:predicted nucleic acid-binding protein
VPLYFFDTSALVKRYVVEPGSTWVQSITDPTAANTIFVAQITGVEVIATLSRRIGSISPADATRLISSFRHDFTNQYQVLAINDALIAEAMNVAEKHRLRGYDAVQFTAAVQVHTALAAMGGSAAVGGMYLILVSADQELNNAAAARGLVVEDPNNH